ncbi:MAG TPA: transglycosylase domain-containing protein [Solirubrobacteraceae bacterium]|nr:transglycosylase domain-containing protein [Solirubrobacteraceae bacterium]
MSRQARQRRRRHNRAGPGRILLVGLGVVALGMIIGAVAAVGYVLSISDDTPALSSLHTIVKGAPSQVFAADGTRLGFIQSDNLRSPVSWREIPTNLKNATVAIEDQRFYQHNGVDLTGIFRSAVKDVTHGSALQGGSTITMQLVRNLYIGGSKRSFKQKVSEAKLAIDYEKRHNKHEILTTYLNSIPYGTYGGQTAIGVQAAARIFFDKPVWRLNLQQAALVAGLPQAPSQYNPFHSAGAAKRRRNEVLGKMAQLHYVSAAQAAAAKAAPLGVKHGTYYSQRRESFFFDYVRQKLINRYGIDTVEQGGLKVYTTIDLNMQRQARQAIGGVLNEPNDPAAAVVTIDPANGHIQAMAESQGYHQSQYNLAAQGHRQPGSTFKAIVLADALSRGIDPNSTYYLSHTLSPGWLTGYPTYEVKTFEGTSLGSSVNLVHATLASDNTVYAQLAADLGESTVTTMAHRLGVTSHLDSYPAEALGGLTVGVTPLEMANVYATLADGGWRNRPIAVTRVVFPDKHVDRSLGRSHRVKVLSDGITAEETKILEENVQGGTAVRSAIGCPSAAKTGTTSDLIDAWLDGYTPDHSTAVWMGYPNKRVSMTSVHGEAQQGGRLPAQIWHDYMSQVVGSKCKTFPTPTQTFTHQAFFGKFATTGLSSLKSTSTTPDKSTNNKDKKKPPGSQGNGGTGTGTGTPGDTGTPNTPATGNRNGTAPGGAGVAPGAPVTPGAKRTGGAAPGQ